MENKASRPRKPKDKLRGTPFSIRLTETERGIVRKLGAKWMLEREGDVIRHTIARIAAAEGITA